MPAKTKNPNTAFYLVLENTTGNVVLLLLELTFDMRQLEMFG
jgi:hypothetical protein